MEVKKIDRSFMMVDDLYFDPVDRHHPRRNTCQKEN